jgi:hypothetical protein
MRFMMPAALKRAENGTMKPKHFFQPRAQLWRSIFCVALVALCLIGCLVLALLPMITPLSDRAFDLFRSVVLLGVGAMLGVSFGHKIE